MSAELPQLERLLADAAERHYGGRRRLHLPRPRPALVAGLVAAAAAVVLAIAILPLRSDERSARPPSDPAAALAARYSVFGPAPDAGPRAFEVARDQLDALDGRKPVAARWLRRFAGGGIVALAGTTPQGKAAICISEEHTRIGGGSCQHMSDLLSADRPWFPFGVPGQSQTSVTAFVPDTVISVSMELRRGGEPRTVPIRRNLAYARPGETVCRVSWTTADGRVGQQPSLFASDSPC